MVFFIASIQAFWFEASGEADSTANSPSPPVRSMTMSAITTPMEPKSTCATKNDSPLPDGIGLSHVTTLVPAACAATATGSIWSPALLDSMTTFCFCVVAVVSIST